VVLGAVALAVAGADPVHAQPGAQPPAGPVIECEVVEQGGYQSARYRLSNPGDAPVDYRFAAVLENNGNTWSSDPVAGTLDAGAETVREFRPFARGVTIDRCAAAISSAAVSPPAPLRPPPAHPTWVEEGPRHFHGDRALAGILLGGVGAIGLGLGGGFIGAEIECWDGCPGWFGGMGGAVIGGSIGYLLGSTFGVGLAWDHAGASSPYGAAFYGTLLGALTGIGLALLIGDVVDPEFTVGILLASPPTGATVAIALTHQHPGGGLAIGPLLHLRDGDLTAGIPLPTRTSIDGATITTVPLAGGRF
jgi:hypothetical protein